MATLAALLEGFSADLCQGSWSLPIAGVTADSRKVETGWAFVALRGFHSDGHQFILQAIERGAVAVILEGTAGLALPPHVSCVQVADSRRALAHIAAAFYGHPSHTVALIGVTGTNGKTTSTYLIEAMLQANGFTPGVVGTGSYRYASR
ncbi:MAG: UDP-N-acetylmuramoyl-L-alanyl-D-glutamate--2,6-diaminopimelate ligase, partial [Nitrospinae bacterium]|nr:UDP-N-acetylmuramoyl-L-alanyl-D-glutamate--2,6-diaminopimelate ligase [Nitrospinota bacterium]